MPDHKNHASCTVLVKAVPPKNYAVKQSSSVNNHSNQSRLINQTTKNTATFVNKKTGVYARKTNKESYSTGETFKERSTERVGYKDEYKTTSTYRVGDKSGSYIEYQVEKRVSTVSYGGSGNKSKGGRDKCVTYKY